MTPLHGSETAEEALKCPQKVFGRLLSPQLLAQLQEKANGRVADDSSPFPSTGED